MTARTARTARTASREYPRRADTVHMLPPMWSWQEFVDRAVAPDSIVDGAGRDKDDEWAGASWQEALRLAEDGWTPVLPEVDAEIAELRERVGDEVLRTSNGRRRTLRWRGAGRCSPAWACCGLEQAAPGS
jgi:hypothetical protein